MKSSILIAGCSLVAVVICSCSKPPPSKADIEQALSQHLYATGSKVGSVTVTRIGDQGHADFDAPGSQDAYWPVAYSYAAQVEDIGPLKVSTQRTAEAKVWRDKLGNLRVEQVPVPRGAH